MRQFIFLRFRYWLAGLLMIGLLVGCTPAQEDQMVQSAVTAVAAAPTTLPATETTVAPSENTPDTAVIPPPPGLIYSLIDNGIWQIDAQGQPRLLTSRQDALVAPDGRHAAYLDENGVYS